MFTIIHESGRMAKNGEGLVSFIMRMASGGHEVDVGRRAQLQKQCTGAFIQVLYHMQFWTPDVSMAESTHFDW